MNKILKVFMFCFICMILIVSGCSKKGDEIKTESIHEGLERQVDKNLYAVYNKMRVHYIGNVEGECAFIELGNGQTMLISNVHEQDYYKIIKYLRSFSYKTLDYVVLVDKFAEGLEEILQNFSVDKLYLPPNSDALKGMEIKDTQTYAIETGNILQSGPLLVNLFISDFNFEKNEYEILISILYGEASFVFAASDEQFIKEQLGKTDIDVVSCCDIKSIENFIEETNSKAIVTAYSNENNSLEDVYCTEEIGTVIITADTNKEIIVNKG